MARPGVGQRAALLLIRGYQLTVSAVIGRQCRYLPTCSDYAAEAVRRHGLWVGGWMSTARLCRCHPFGSWGYDPVPPRREAVPVLKPWRHGIWRMPAIVDGPAEGDGQDRASSSAARP